MLPSKSADKLRDAIEKAIEDHEITSVEYNEIMAIALEDGHIDTQEQQLLEQLQQMIAHKEVKIKA